MHTSMIFGTTTKYFVLLLVCSMIPFLNAQICMRKEKYTTNIGTLSIAIFIHGIVTTCLLIWAITFYTRTHTHTHAMLTNAR